LVAVQIGGLPLVFGMTVFAGAVEVALSRFLNRLRPYFPPEIAGLIVMLVGITTAAIAVRYLVEPTGHLANEKVLIVAAATLGIMIALNVWTRGTARMVCALIGVVVGYGLAAVFGVLSTNDLAVEGGAPIFGLPHLNHLNWSFDLALVLPFSVSAIASALKAMAVISICQKINDAEWVRPNLKNIRTAVVADGLSTVLAGMAGTAGVNSSPSCVGLSAATGVTARAVAYAIAVILAVAAFLPRVSLTLAIMPKPVIAAALLFTACFLLINGMQVITSRMLDSRKTFVVGLTIVASLAVELFPHIADNAPALIRPITGSSLVLGTVLALIMNMAFRVGLRQKVAVSFDPAQDEKLKLDNFLDEHGANWGARRDIIIRARFALLQVVEAATQSDVRSPFHIEASFDEFSLDLTVSYDGDLLELPSERPSVEEICDSPDGALRLAGFLLRRIADRTRSERAGKRAVVRFHFDH
jgi:NCS2 family nucleobase:cation symporter-2